MRRGLGGRGTQVRCAASWLLAARAILQFCALAAAGTARGRTWLPVTSDPAAQLGAGPADGLLTTEAGTRSRSPDQDRGSRSRLRRRLRAGGVLHEMSDPDELLLARWRQHDNQQRNVMHPVNAVDQQPDHRIIELIKHLEEPVIA